MEHSVQFNSVQFSSFAQSCLTLRPHESQHARPPCPSPTPRVYSNSCPLSLLFKRITNRQIWFSKLEYSLFPGKRTRGTYHFKKSNWRLFVTKNIIEDFKQKLGFWKICVCHSELNKRILQNFLMRSAVILMCDFLDTIKWNVSTFGWAV